MKAYIGPYRSWIGPYQIAERLVWWDKRKAHSFGSWLSKNRSGDPSLITRLCQWIHNKRQRTVRVVVDKYDSWNADVTIAHLARPVLVQLRDSKYSFGMVDDCDVPEHLRSHNAPTPPEFHSDALAPLRWNWMLDEVIWALGTLTGDELDDDQFYGFDGPRVDNSGKPPREGFFQIQIDEAGLRDYEERRRKALVMFGKYYFSFWD